MNTIDTNNTSSSNIESEHVIIMTNFLELFCERLSKAINHKIQVSNTTISLDEEEKYEPYKEKSDKNGKRGQGFITINKGDNERYKLGYDVQLKRNDQNPHIDLYLKEYKDKSYKIIQQINFYNNEITIGNFEKEGGNDHDIIHNFSEKIKDIASILLKNPVLKTGLLTKNSILNVPDIKNEGLLKKTKEELLKELERIIEQN